MANKSCHFDFYRAGEYSYEQVFTLMNRLDCNHIEKQDFFRRMVFNIAACNCDDHVKNFSFLMDKSGLWHLAPAYDVCFAYNPAGRWTSAHQMTVNGKTADFEKSDFEQCRKIAGLKQSEVDEIIIQVLQAVQNWHNFAEQSNVRVQMIDSISNCFVSL